MTPVQHALSSILSVPKPFVASEKLFYSASGSLTVEIPTRPGRLCVVSAFTRTTGTGAPSLLSGFTSLAFNNGASWPGNRFMYKFMDGTETSTMTTTSASGVEMFAYVYGIDTNLKVAPQVATLTSSSSSSPNPTNLNTTSVARGRVLYFAHFAGDGDAAVNSYPQGFIRSDGLEFRSGTMMGASARRYGNLSGFDPSAFELSANVGYRSIHFSVVGSQAA